MAGENSKIRESIIHAALTLFREKGYDSVSVNEICRKAYVAHSSFYYLFSGKQEILQYLLNEVRVDERTLSEALLFAKNDFERMWAICCRYLDIAISLGPKLSAELMRLELTGVVDVLRPIHSVDSWFIRFTENGQQQGVIRSNLPAEFLGPFGIDNVYKLVYDWNASQGGFSLVRRAREMSEILYDIAPEYRMTDAELKKLEELE